MTRRLQENILVLVIIGVFIAVIFASLGYSGRARMVPLPMAVLGCLLAIAQLVWQNVRPADDLEIDMFEFITGRTVDEEPAAVQSVIEAAPPPVYTAPPRTALREFTAFGIVGVLFAMFFLLGPIPTTFLFTAGYLIISGKYSPTRCVLYAALLTVLLTVVFGHVLQVQLDRALLMPSIGPYIGL